MAVSPGLYGLTLEKFLIDTAGQSLEAEDNNVTMVTNAHTPNFDTHDFHADLDNEIAGGNFAPEALTSTEITLASGVLTFDAADVVYDNSAANDVTVTNAEASVLYTSVSGTATDQLVVMNDFGSAQSSSNSTFTIQWHTSGIFTIDYVP